ncbi:hypothetical protein H696_01334 [Fonticula alba]|uniref:Kazal-like domain-containing protein n=1 Tax=Fonticula alba TaxID=691883 RepID=A0A058ZBZ7_FONAL|nr:hypothetical protein H696_01334 [Fonticula alba]KCV71924.1 hypothetical protein H696_01334 [Fonticula alba]|eukprot:XP_009493502.1 hypothetical protein H696_01334 [Fonticula alba]
MVSYSKMSPGRPAALLALLLMALISTAHAFTCPILFSLRQSAIDSNNPKSVLGYNGAIKALGCCNSGHSWKAPHCQANSGPVCGYDFETYPNACDLGACRSGVQFTGACKPQPHVLDCGPVCGYDFETYPNACDLGACRSGVQFTGACKPQPHVLDCYMVPLDQMAQRAACFQAALMRIIQSVDLNNTPPDPEWRLAQPCVVPGQYDLTQWRTADGRCNNPTPERSYSGMTGLYFIRHDKTRFMPANVDLAVASGPNPRLVSNLLFKRKTFTPNPVGLSGLAMAFLNFFIHDFFLPEVDWADMLAIPIPPNDPVYPYSEWSGEEHYMYLPKTRVHADGTVRNQVTAWFDGSQVYGSTQSRMDSLRTFQGGRMLADRKSVVALHVTAWFDGSQVYGSTQSRMDSLRTFQGGRMLADPVTGFAPDEPASGNRRRRNPNHPALFLLGDDRGNQHAGLTAMHLLFVNEHNNVAAMLEAAYPHLSDEELFQRARLIVGAELFKIQTIEMSTQLVADIPSQLLVASLWSGYATKEYNELAIHATPFDFNAAYRFHAMVPETLQLRDRNGTPLGDRVNYIDTFHNTTLLRQYGYGPVLIGLASEVAGKLTFNNVPDAIRNIRHTDVTYSRSTPFGGYFGPSLGSSSRSKCVVQPFLDIGTVDVVRDRERGVPRANDYYARIGLPELRATHFGQIAPTPEGARAVADLYDWDINNVDFIVGLLGFDSTELDGIPIISTAGFLPFVYSRNTHDRFYTKDWLTPSVYTQAGFDRLMGTSTNPGGVTLAQIMVEAGVLDQAPANNGVHFATRLPGLEVFKVWKWD